MLLKDVKQTPVFGVTNVNFSHKKSASLFKEALLKRELRFFYKQPTCPEAVTVGNVEPL